MISLAIMSTRPLMMAGAKAIINDNKPVHTSSVD
jgi:hypothetical protein